jgi:hypothetical protein
MGYRSLIFTKLAGRRGRNVEKSSVGRLANNQSGLTYLTSLIAKPQSGQIQARVFFLLVKSNQKR